MFTLLIRLKGPMQSWGTHSHFTDRDTSKEPTKSGVIGMICSALGLPRDRDLSDYSRMRFGVRVNKEGKIKTEFQTGQEIRIGREGKKEKRQVSYLSYNHYLTDADFIAGLEHNDKAFLEQILNALVKPKWFISLGKKSYVPSLPVFIKDGIVEKDLIHALQEHELQYQDYLAIDKNYDPETRKVRLRFAVDDPDKKIKNATMTQIINDNPINFGTRKFKPRYVTTFMREVEVIEEDKDVSD